MIEQTMGWRFGDALYPVLKDAQVAALAGIFRDLNAATEIASTILGRRDEVIKILSLEAPKERKPRADKGTKRTKKIAPVVTKTPNTTPV